MNITNSGECVDVTLVVGAIGVCGCVVLLTFVTQETVSISCRSRAEEIEASLTFASQESLRKVGAVPKVVFDEVVDLKTKFAGPYVGFAVDGKLP